MDAAASAEAGRIFFLHLPKTGGTSLWATLNRIAGVEGVLHVHNSETRQRFVELSQDVRDRYMVVGGHLDLPLCRALLDLSRYQCVTVFREPIERVVSEYRYARRTPRHSGHEKISRMSLREFAASPFSGSQVTKLLCGRADATAAFAAVKEVFDDWVFMDEVDRLVARLQAEAGQPPTFPAVLNMSPPADAEVDRETLAIIEEHNAADIELFELLVADRRTEAEEGSARTSVPVDVRSGRSGPVFHVVTPTFNSATYLDATIASVVSQAGAFSIRYHVQDGGSTDATASIVRHWQKRLARGDARPACLGFELTFDSRPDNGMYDAIAAGFRHLDPPADGLMTWINSDDLLASSAMADVAAAFADLPETEVLGGRLATIDAAGVPKAEHLFLYPRATLAAGLHDEQYLPLIMQEGTFWRAALWQRTGGIDPTFRLAGDWDLWRRFAIEAEHPILDTVLAYHRRRPGQLSEDKAAYYREIAERMAARRAASLPVLDNYLLASRPGEGAAAPSYPAWVGRRGPDGHWALSADDGPAPLRLARARPLDGQWYDVGGFGPPEGPLPKMGIDAAFQWIGGDPATLMLHSEIAGRRRVLIELRSLVRRQKVRISFGNGPIRRYRLHGGFPRFPDLERIRIAHDFAAGPTRLTIQAERTISAPEGRELGVMFTGIRFVR